VREYLKSCTEKIDDYRIELAFDKTRGKECVLDRVQHAVCEFSDAEVIRDYKEMSDELKGASDISTIERCSVQCKVLVPTREFNSLFTTL